MLANNCPEPGKVISGISELLINAIEHGNLHIDYDEKSDLKKQGKWREEIEHRLQLIEFRDKTASVKFNKNGKTISITITDQGKGFDWQQYLEFNPDRPLIVMVEELPWPICSVLMNFDITIPVMR